MLCERCRGELTPYRGPACGRCGVPMLILAPLCPECKREPPPFTRAFSRSLYEGKMEGLVRRLKFQDAPQLAEPLACLMAEEWRERGLQSQPFDLVTAVPLSKASLSRRGYNQAALLARTLARELGLPYRESLRKVRRTAAQARLGREQRLTNQRGAFTVSAPLAGERVLLIDDVMTTGATARECATTLMTGGAGEVWVYTLARWTGSQRGRISS
ncbi:MAG: ComF family protein [Chloroflexi bacterium]|nr:ComF family protein [Chloroflexota bacterium]